MHTYPGFHADDLLFGVVGFKIWIIDINTKEHGTVPNVSLYYVTQLIVDPNGEAIYWSEFLSQTVNSVKWDGTNRRVIHKSRNCKCVCVLINLNGFLKLCWNSILHIAFSSASIHF